MLKDRDTLSPICLCCGKRAQTNPVETGHSLWASLEAGWLVGVRKTSSGSKMVFACSEDCASEADELSDRARRSGPGLMKARPFPPPLPA